MKEPLLGPISSGDQRSKQPGRSDKGQLLLKVPAALFFSLTCLPTPGSSLAQPDGLQSAAIPSFSAHSLHESETFHLAVKDGSMSSISSSFE